MTITTSHWHATEMPMCSVQSLTIIIKSTIRVSLDYVYTKESKSTLFLDTCTSIGLVCTILTEHFVKPTYIGVLLHHKSTHPRSTKRAMANMQMKRAVNMVGNAKEKNVKDNRGTTLQWISWGDCLESPLNDISFLHTSWDATTEGRAPYIPGAVNIEGYISRSGLNVWKNSPALRSILTLAAKQACKGIIGQRMLSTWTHTIHLRQTGGAQKSSPMETWNPPHDGVPTICRGGPGPIKTIHYIVPCSSAFWAKFIARHDSYIVDKFIARIASRQVDRKLYIHIAEEIPTLTLTWLHWNLTLAQLPTMVITTNLLTDAKNSPSSSSKAHASCHTACPAVQAWRWVCV